MNGTKTGASGKLKISPPKLFIETIRFEGQIDIWYCRIPDKRVTYVVAPTGTVHTLPSPPEIMPAGGDVHWKRRAGTTQEEISWPAAYIRDGATGAGAKKVHVAFSASDVAFNGSLLIKAVSDVGITIPETAVSFTSGKTAEIPFDLKNLPKTVRWLSGLTFHWKYRSSTNPNSIPAHDTRHTFFILDAPPLKANLDDEDKFLFEILDWACRWASGRSGSANVLAAIWEHFHPVRAEHDTGLVYWKNHQIPYINRIMPQNIVDAIQAQDDSDPKRRNGASCIVFDRIFINCLLAHGITAAEIMVIPSRILSRGPWNFDRSGITYECTGWNAKSIIGQGNPHSPSGWGSHWVADVHESSGNWQIYDPSYGVAPYATGNPNASPVTLSPYEPDAVKSFSISQAPFDISRDPVQDPHLYGHVLWKP